MAAVPSPCSASPVGLTMAPDSNYTPWVVAGDQSGSQTVNQRLEHFNSMGSLLSSISLPNANGKNTFAVAFDRSGDVWVSGGATSGGNDGLGLWEFDSTGSTLLGQQTYFSAYSGGQLRPGTLAVDSSGNAWVPVAEQYAAGFAFQYGLLKYGPNVTFVSYTTYRRGGGEDGGFSAGIDNNTNNLWVAGVSSNPANGQIDLALWEYNASGVLQSGYPVFWPDAYTSINGNNSLNIELGVNSSVVWIATAKQFATCANPDFALLSFNATTGVQISTSLWHDSGDLGSTPNALAFDLQGSGNVSVLGQSAGGETALWQYSSSGNLLSSYPQTGSAGANGLIAFGSNAIVFNTGANGDQPNEFTSNGTIPGASGASSCSQPSGSGNISGVITNPSGFSNGGSVYIGVSTTAFQGNGNPAFYQFPTSGGTTLPYTVSLQAPATYSIIAVYGNPQSVTSATPIGAYNGFASVAVTAGNTSSNINFSVYPDATPPTSSVTSFNDGATLTALSSISGTAADNAAVQKVFLAVEDQTTGLWWDIGSQQWITPGTTPNFQDGGGDRSGTPNAVTWIQNVSTSSYQNNFGGLAGSLATGHQYKVFSQAEDLAQNFETNPGGRSFYWNGSSGQLPPSAPANVFSQVLGVSSITWNWTASAGATGYGLWAGTSVFLSSVTQTSYTGTQLSTNTSYQLCVEAFNVYGQSALTCASPMYTYAATPGQPFFTFISSGSLVYTWDPAGNPPGTTFQAYLSTNNFATIYSIQNTTQTLAVFTGQFISGLTFSAAVQAFNGNNIGSDYSQSASTTILAPPPPPQNIMGQALGISSISWHWSPSASATSYNLYTDTGAFIASVSTTCFKEVGLSTASPYNLCVSGVNAAGEGQQGCSSAVYTLAAVPGTPYFTAVSSTALSVQWDPEGNPSGVVYQVLLSTDGFVNSVSTPVAFSAADQQNSANLIGLSPFTTYYVQVQAENTAGAISSLSQTAATQTALAPPANLQALVLGVSSISWTWSASPGAVSYNVFTNTGSLLATVTTTAFLAVGLSTNSQSAVCVAAFNAGNQSAPTCFNSVFTLAATPGQLFFSSITTASLTLTWDAAGNPDGTFYQASLSTDGFSNNVSTPVAFASSFTLTSAVLVGLAPGTTYYARVQAENYGGVATTPSPIFAGQTKLPEPANVQGMPLGVSSISWSWSASPGAASYIILSTTGFLLGTAASAPFSEIGLSTNSAYAVCVAAVNGSDQSDPACSQQVYTLTAVPGQPVFSSISYSSATLSWDPAGNPPGTLYQVLLSTDDFVANVSTPVPFAAGLAATSTALVHLAADTTYYAAVQALGGDGIPTATSSTGSATTLLFRPRPPVDLTASASGYGITLSWQPASGGVPAVAYDIYRGVSADSSTYIALISGVTTTLYVDFPSQTATFYYQVAGVNVDGVEGRRSSEAVIGLDITPPQQITDLRMISTNLSQGQLQLAWTAPLDTFSGTARYFLFSSQPIDPAGQILCDYPNTYQTIIATIPAQAVGSTVTYTIAVSSAEPASYGVAAQDGAGNIQFCSNVVTFDLVPPLLLVTTGSAFSPGFVNNQTISRPLMIYADVAPDSVGFSSIVFTFDGAIVSSYNYSGGGTETGLSQPYFWDIRLLADGIHTFGVAAYDTVGNGSSMKFTETINYAPPDQPVILGPAPGFITKVATIDVVGTGDPYTNIQVMANGLDIDTVAVPGTGNQRWVIAPVTLPAEGDVSLTAVSYEARGFSAPSQPVNGVFTHQPPNPPENPTATGLPGGTAQIAWSAPTGATAPRFYRVYRSTDDTVLLIDGPPPDASLRIGDAITQLSFTDAPAFDDLYFYGVTAVDGSGNESPLSAIVYAQTDRVPPTAQVLFSTPPPVSNGTYQPAFAVSKVLAQPPVFTFTPPGGVPTALNLTPVTATLWQTTFTITPAMSSGTALFSFQGIDMVGNVGTFVSSSTLLIRNIGPVGAVSLSKTSPLSIGTLTFTLLLDEPAVSPPPLAVTPQNRPEIPITLSAAAPFDGTAWTGTLAVNSNTGDGQAVISYSGTDALGNTSTSLSAGTTSFVIKTVPPGVPQAVRATGLPADQVLVSWSAPSGERPAYYHIYRDSILLSTNVSPAPDGTGSYTDTTSQGLHQYQVSSLDLAGNESAPTDPVVQARDTPPSPPISVTSGFNGFNQVQVAWQAGSTDTASFNVYRTTYSVTNASGLAPLSRNAATPLTDAPTTDGIYYYGITALDSVGNESAASIATVTWTQGVPAITIAGVTDGSYYNTNVVPSFTVVDMTLDPTSVHALLDGAAFVSGSTVTAEGHHTFSVSAANIAGHAASATASFVIDKTPPQISFSVGQGALITSTVPVAVQVTLAEQNPNTSAFMLVNLLSGTTAFYVPGSPIGQNGQYTLTATATDLAGNSSTATVSFTLEVGPPTPTNLKVTIGNSAQVSWTSPEPDVVGYQVFRDGQRISASLLTDTFFQDNGFTPGQHVYQVLALDANGVKGPKAQATVPAASLTLPAQTLTRGFFDALQPAVQNNSSVTLSVGPVAFTLTDANVVVVASATAPAVSAGAGQSVTLQGVIATPPALTAASLLNVMVALPTDPGAAVFLSANATLQAQDPAQPVVEVLPNPLVLGTLSSVQTRFNNRGSAPLDVITAQVANSTFAATNSVVVQLLSSQGALLGQAGLLQTGDGANSTIVNGRQVFFVTIPPGLSFLFDAVKLLVPNSVTTNLQVQALVSTPAYNLAGLDLAGTEGFSASVSQAATRQVPYTATALTDRAVYDQGSTVLISGQAQDVNGAIVANASVTAHVILNGFDRQVNAVTDSSGNYTAAFSPMPQEAGVYSVFAANPAVATQAPQSSFTIVGFGFPYPNFSAALAQNSSLRFTVGLQNTGATPLTGINANTSITSAQGVSLALDPTTLPSTLAPGAQATLGLTVSATPSASSATLSLSVYEAHGFVRTLPVAVTVQPAQVIPSVTPQSFQIGMLAGQTNTQVITLQNQGFVTWQGVSLTSPTLSWVSIQGSTSIGNIPPGANANFVLTFSPPAGQTNATYAQNPLIQVVSQNASTIPINAGVTVTSSLQGTIAFNIINADKPLGPSGLGVAIPGALVTLNSLDVPGLNFNAGADSNGFAQFANIPSGNYAWTIKASGFQPNSGTTIVNPGLSQSQRVPMFTATVTYDWSVTPISLTDSYQLTLTLLFHTDVPAPALTVDPPVIALTLGHQQTAYSQFTLTNVGLVSAFNVAVNPPTGADLTVVAPFTTIPEIKPHQSVVVPLKITSNSVPCLSEVVDIVGNYLCAAGIPGACGAKVTLLAQLPGSECFFGTWGGGGGISLPAGPAIPGTLGPPVWVPAGVQVTTKGCACDPLTSVTISPPVPVEAGGYTEPLVANPVWAMPPAGHSPNPCSVTYTWSPDDGGVNPPYANPGRFISGAIPGPVRMTLVAKDSMGNAKSASATVPVTGCDPLTSMGIFPATSVTLISEGTTPPFPTISGLRRQDFAAKPVFATAAGQSPNPCPVNYTWNSTPDLGDFLQVVNNYDPTNPTNPTTQQNGYLLSASLVFFSQFGSVSVTGVDSKGNTKTSTPTNVVVLPSLCDAITPKPLPIPGTGIFQCEYICSGRTRSKTIPISIPISNECKQSRDEAEMDPPL
jgi:fibronectin type 3 domain-containing protein